MHLLLMPGFDGTGEQFAPLIEALGPAYRITCVRYARERSFEACVNAAASALPEEAVIPIAESFSGPIALALMARYPSRFRCAVLCATFAVSPFRPLLSTGERFANALFARNPWKNKLLETFCLNGLEDERIAHLATRVADAIELETIRARLRVLREVDVRALLERIATPTLYLRATRDRIVSRRHSASLIRGLRDVELQEINGPHLLLQARAVECAAAIRAFLARHSAER